MFCPKCGSQINDTAVFCPKCGLRVSDEPNQSTETNNTGSGINSSSAKSNDSIKQQTSSEKNKSKALKIGLISAAGIAVAGLLIGLAVSSGNSSSAAAPATAAPAAREENAAPSNEEGSTVVNDQSEANETNDITQPEGKGVTVLVYMIGSDLESNGGMATTDIDEMMQAKYGENVHVIIQTGGAKEWWKSGVDGKTVNAGEIQRYQVFSGAKELIDTQPKKNMGSAESLGEFLKWGVETFPAEKYIAILWNHGGGTVDGYGYDELFNDEHIELDELREAFAQGGYRFDIVGFDACLMATMETAYALKDYTHYMIASEETEWGKGWYYTDWLNALGNNPELDTEEIGKRIVDGYTDSVESESYYAFTMGENAEPTPCTLSLLNLEKADDAYRCISSYFENAKDRMLNGGYNDLAEARQNARSYGSVDAAYVSQVDVIDFLSKAGLATEAELEKQLSGSNGFITYERNNYEGSHGLAMYFPYYKTCLIPDLPCKYENVSSKMKKLGIKSDYFAFFDSYVGILADSNDTSFTPQFEIENVNEILDNATDSNPYYEPVLDENGQLPTRVNADGIIEIDLSKQTKEYIDSITNVVYHTFRYDEDSKQFVLSTDIPAVEWSKESIKLVPQDEGIMTMTTDRKMMICQWDHDEFGGPSDGDSFSSGPIYGVPAVINDEQGLIAVQKTYYLTPDHTPKEWRILGYSTKPGKQSDNLFFFDISALKRFEIGDTVNMLYYDYDMELYQSGTTYTVKSLDQYNVMDHFEKYWYHEDGSEINGSESVPMIVVCWVMDSFGKQYYAIGKYKPTNYQFQ